MPDVETTRPQASAEERPLLKPPAGFDAVERRPVRTFAKLAIASLIVGLFLSFLGLNPVEFWRGAWRMISSLVSMLGDTAIEIIRNLATYLAFGAAIVVPLWIAHRLLNGRRR